MSAGSAFGEKLHQVSWTCFSRPIPDDVQLSEELMEELEVLMKVNYNARMMPVKRSDILHGCASEVLAIRQLYLARNDHAREADSCVRSGRDHRTTL